MSYLQKVQTSIQSRILKPFPSRSSAVKLNSHFVPKLGDSAEPGPPLIFLHGLLGSVHTFKFYAQNDKIQKLKSSYLLESRNHGHSERAKDMCYLS